MRTTIVSAVADSVIRTVHLDRGIWCFQASICDCKKDCLKDRSQDMDFQHCVEVIPISPGRWINVSLKPLLELFVDHGNRCCRSSRTFLKRTVVFAAKVHHFYTNRNSPFQTDGSVSHNVCG